MSHLTEILRKQVPKGTICLTNISVTTCQALLMYDSLVCPLSGKLFEFIREKGEIITAQQQNQFNNSLSEIVKRVVFFLSISKRSSRTQSVQKIARQEIEDFDHFLQNVLSSL